MEKWLHPSLLLAISFLLLPSVSSTVGTALTSSYNPSGLPWGFHYLGDWSTKTDNLFAVFTVAKGRAKLACKAFDVRKGVTPDPERCSILMFNGDWEDDDIYAIIFTNSTYDPETSTLSIHTIGEFISTSEKLLSVRIEGLIHYQASSVYAFTAQLKCENGVRLTLQMTQQTIEDIKSPKVKYSFIVTVISMCQLFAVLIFAKECADSERVAKAVSTNQTSKAFLLMNCIIDCALWLWHMNLAFKYFDTFDYLMIGALWSLFVFLIVHKRLLPIVWLAQNRERFQMVILTQGIELFSAEFNAYQNRFLMHVMISVIVFFVFSSLYLFFIFLIHLCFVPQILSNALTRERNRIKESIYLTLGFSRLLLLVRNMQMYIFGCPKNFLVWQPKDWFWMLMVLIVVGQMAILYLQNSRRRKWLFADINHSQPQHDYYSIPSILPPNQHDCVICLTALSLPGVPRASIVNASVTMRPPCGHMFHKDCLRNWMRIKLECPTCRGSLPRLDEEDEDQYSD